MNNLEKFSCLKSLELPIGRYAITGSGLLGIRNLREIGDIDIIVSDDLWFSLTNEYDIKVVDGLPRVAFPDGVVEAFRESEFFADYSAPPILDRIGKAEVIEGLPFEPLENILHYKRLMGRPKDLKDIQLLCS